MDNIKTPRIGLIMGCFDLLHHGHRKVLEESKARCDFLVVGLATDETVTAVKGEGRPVVDMHNRTQMLNALRYVDQVRPFTLKTQAQVVLDVMPDVCFSGIGGNARLQEILDDFQLNQNVHILNTEIIHTTDLLNNKPFLDGTIGSELNDEDATLTAVYT